MLGKCLDTNGPAYGSPGDQQVKLWECNGLDYQQWQLRPDGTLYSPRTQRCLDWPAGWENPRLYLHACQALPNQQFAVPAMGGR